MISRAVGSGTTISPWSLRPHAAFSARPGGAIVRIGVSRRIPADAVTEYVAGAGGHGPLRRDAKPATTAGYVKRLGRRPETVARRAAAVLDAQGAEDQPVGGVRNQVAGSASNRGATGVRTRDQRRMPANHRRRSGRYRGVRRRSACGRVCGAGGIRTHGSRRIGSFQDCCLRPLGHRSRGARVARGSRGGAAPPSRGRRARRLRLRGGGRGRARRLRGRSRGT